MSIVIAGGNDRMTTYTLLVVFTEICSNKMPGTVKKSSAKSGVPVEQIIGSSVSAL